MDRATIDALAAELMVKQKAARVAEHSKIWEPLSTTATDLGYECERRIVYHRCYPKDAAPFGEELLSIFSEGDLHQKDVRRELGALGFEVVESEVRFSDKKLDMAGTIDGKIVVSADRNSHTQKRIPIEIKSTTGGAPATEQELRESENGLLRRYYAQMQAYLYLSAEPYGLFVFKDKITGIWTVVSVGLDYEYAEKLLKRAERARDFVRRIEKEKERGPMSDETLDVFLPERIVNRSECSGCPWAQTKCFPADAPVDPLLLAKDDRLESQIVRRMELDAGRREFEKLDEEIKSRFKLTSGTRFVVGTEWLVTKRPWGKGVKVEIAKLGTVTE